MAIKNNIASTELSTDPDRILCRQKVANLLQCLKSDERKFLHLEPPLIHTVKVPAYTDTIPYSVVNWIPTV